MNVTRTLSNTDGARAEIAYWDDVPMSKRAVRAMLRKLMDVIDKEMEEAE